MHITLQRKMSVTDPIIQELKGYTGKFLELFQKNEVITDDTQHFPNFCSCLEEIFYSGIISTSNSFGFIRRNDPWTWMEAESKRIENYPLRTCVGIVKEQRNIFTNLGKFRLLLRYCLTKKCLHVPVKEIGINGKLDKYYDVNNSIIGDEILGQIFLSVLYQLSKITFHLELKNASFMDLSWILPEVLRIELVPTQNLGMSISFAGEKAIIIKIKSNSVTEECSKVAIGDVLDNLNGVCICSAMKGRLSSLLKCQKGRPITITVIKGIFSKTGLYYPPLIKLYKRINLDFDEIKSSHIKSKIDNEDSLHASPMGQKIAKKKCSGFKAIFMGAVSIGRIGDIKLIDKALSILLSSPSPSNSPGCKNNGSNLKQKVEVNFEVGELGVKVTDRITQEVILKHSYMQITGCGSAMLMPLYFAYIASEENCTKATDFKCFIFMAESYELSSVILQGIGQGFQRTHYAV